MDQEQLKYILKMSDVAFVKAAYNEILKREPDEEGWINYLKCIYNGISKEEILISICNSDEAKKINVISPIKLKELLRFVAKNKNIIKKIKIKIKSIILNLFFKNEYEQMIKNTIKIYITDCKFNKKTIISRNGIEDITKNMAQDIFNDYIILKGYNK